MLALFTPVILLLILFAPNDPALMILLSLFRTRPNDPTNDPASSLSN